MFLSAACKGFTSYMFVFSVDVSGSNSALTRFLMKSLICCKEGSCPLSLISPQGDNPKDVRACDVMLF